MIIFCLNSPNFRSVVQATQVSHDTCSSSPHFSLLDSPTPTTTQQPEQSSSKRSYHVAPLPIMLLNTSTLLCSTYLGLHLPLCIPFDTLALLNPLDPMCVKYTGTTPALRPSFRFPEMSFPKTGLCPYFLPSEVFAQMWPCQRFWFNQKLHLLTPEAPPMPFLYPLLCFTVFQWQLDILCYPCLLFLVWKISLTKSELCDGRGLLSLLCSSMFSINTWWLTWNMNIICTVEYKGENPPLVGSITQRMDLSRCLSLCSCC